jgi:hypothetical protein
VNVSKLRDLIIVIWGIISTIALIILTILVSIMYQRVDKLTRMTEDAVGEIGKTVTRINEILDYTSKNIMSPLIGAASIIQGISRGLGIIVGREKK